MVGNIPVGGDSVISVQSMTNTLTTDTNEIADVIKAQFPNTFFNNDK